MTRRQIEDGFTKIPNDILDTLAKTHLSPYETKVLLFIIRKTYGWHKEFDWISLSQIEESTGIAKPNICRTLNSLKDRNIILRPDSFHVGLQEDHQLWCFQKLSLKTMSVICRDNERYQ